MCLHVNGEMVLGADGLAAEGAGESLPLVQSLVVRQGFRFEEAQVALLALGAHLQVRVWRRRKIFLPTQAVLRIRIQNRKRKDPKLLAGSGSDSEPK